MKTTGFRIINSLTQKVNHTSFLSLSTLLLVLATCFTLVACGSDPVAPGNSENNVKSGQENHVHNPSENSQADLPTEQGNDSSSETGLTDASSPELPEAPQEASVENGTPSEQGTESAQEPVTPEVTIPPDVPKTCATPKAPLDLVKAWKDVQLNGKRMYDTLPACGIRAFRFVAPGGMKIKIEISGISQSKTFEATLLNTRSMYKVAQDKPLIQKKSNGQKWLVLTATADKSGEFGLIIDNQSNPVQISYELTIYCDEKCQLQATRFPIVLLHGFAGTDKYFKILEYFYQVKPELAKNGFLAYTTKVAPISNSINRVLELKKQIDAIYKATGARKLNLIAHSQGGVDGRLLISRLGYAKRIASLTTISTPHRGIPIPNLLVPPSQELGVKNMADYNKKYPNSPLVKYFSWAGVTCSRFDSACRKKYKDEVVEIALGATYQLLKSRAGANDGVVPVNSAKWGTFLGEIPADHWDEIGQVADRNNKSFNHRAFYVNEARRLQKLNF